MLLEREAKHNDWRKSFLEIETKVYTSDRFSCLTNDVALRRSNSLSNRYPNVLAYDHSRVHVSHNNEDLYINANLVRATEADRKYILTQGKRTYCLSKYCKCWILWNPFQISRETFSQ